MIEFRCKSCNKLLAKVKADGQLEIKLGKLTVTANPEAKITCPICGTVNVKGG